LPELDQIWPILAKLDLDFGTSLIKTIGHSALATIRHWPPPLKGLDFCEKFSLVGELLMSLLPWKRTWLPPKTF
jgi:hypothetical protein